MSNCHNLEKVLHVRNMECCQSSSVNVVSTSGGTKHPHTTMSRPNTEEHRTQQRTLQLCQTRPPRITEPYAPYLAAAGSMSSTSTLSSSSQLELS